MDKYNIEHEKAVLSALKHDNSVYDDVDLVASDFYKVENRHIFKIIGEIIQHGDKADDLTIVDAVNKAGHDILPGYIAGLDSFTAANIGFYADSVRELSKYRQLNTILLVAIEDIRGLPISEVIEKVEKGITDIEQHNVNDLFWFREVLSDAIEEIENVYKNGDIQGLPSGYGWLDKYTKGFKPGELIILGARPSIGKTALAINMAVRIGLSGKTVGFFSCEMTVKQLAGRVLSSEARLDVTNMKPSDFSRLTDAAGRLYNIPLLFDDTPNISIAQLKGKSRRMRRMGVEIIFVDYLTLIKHGDSRMPRYERVGEISKSIKQLARELSIPIIVLSQLGREAEGQMPTLANLRQSGEIEEDADVVMFLHRQRDESETALRVAKNRNGGTGSIQLEFNPRFVRFDLRDSLYQEGKA